MLLAIKNFFEFRNGVFVKLFQIYFAFFDSRQKARNPIKFWLGDATFSFGGHLFSSCVCLCDDDAEYSLFFCLTTNCLRSVVNKSYLYFVIPKVC